MGYDQLKLFGASLIFALFLALPLGQAQAGTSDAKGIAAPSTSAPIALPAEAAAEKPIVVAGNKNKNKNWNKAYNKNWNKHWNKKVVVVRPYRKWYKRPYYGTVIGGVALGTVLGAAAYAAAAGPPAPGLCWYWYDPYQTQGYWDYCY